MFLNNIGVKACINTSNSLLYFTLSAPVSTNKFSRLISIHFLKNYLREFVKRSKHFLFGDQFHEFSQPFLLIMY